MCFLSDRAARVVRQAPCTEVDYRALTRPTAHHHRTQVKCGSKTREDCAKSVVDKWKADEDVAFAAGYAADITEIGSAVDDTTNNELVFVTHVGKAKVRFLRWLMRWVVWALHHLILYPNICSNTPKHTVNGAGVHWRIRRRRRLRRWSGAVWVQAGGVSEGYTCEKKWDCVVCGQSAV